MARKLHFLGRIRSRKPLKLMLLVTIVVCIFGLFFAPFLFQNFISKVEVLSTIDFPKHQVEKNIIKVDKIFPKFQEKNYVFEYINNVELLRVIDHVKADGIKAWEELNIGVSISSNASNDVGVARRLVCPPSLSAFGERLLQSGIGIFPLPCGMQFGSYITIIGKPHPAQWKYNKFIAQEGKVSQFFIEVQGFKSEMDKMHPPTLLHFNPRPHGDWSGKPVIEHNSRHGQDEWGKSHRCDGEKNDEKVDDQIKCEEWHQEKIDPIELVLPKELLEIQKNSLFEKAKLEKKYPFIEGQEFSLTILAGMEGFHVIVDNHHISSFPYQQGFSIIEATGIVVGGDVDVASIVVTSLPKDDTWKALPITTKEVEMFVGIMSKSDHFVERMAIRKTWIQSRSIQSSKVVARFFVALHNSKPINLQLMNEASYFGDIIILPFIDKYDIVVLKTLEIFKFGYNNVNAKYIMKCDDDTFVRMDGILQEVQRKAITKGLYMGNMNEGHWPLRHGKWAVTIEEWPNEQKYPTYANGPGYVLSKDIVQFIVEQNEMKKLQLYKMEDVNVGLWANQFTKAKYPVKYVNIKKFVQNYCQPNYLCIHYQSPRQMMCLWNKFLASNEAKCC